MAGKGGAMVAKKPGARKPGRYPGQKTTNGASEMQRKFAYEYFRNGGHGTRAAIAAGYSTNNASVSSSQLLSNTTVKAILKELNDKAADEVIVTKREMMMQLKKIGWADARDMFDEFNNLLDIKDIPDDVAAAITAVEIEASYNRPGGVSKKVKLSDKLRAMAQLADLYGYNAPTKNALTDVAGNDIDLQVGYGKAEDADEE